MIKIKLDELLEKNNMSKYRLSTLINARRDTLTKWETQEVRLIDKELLDAICEALDCNVEDIIEFVPNEKSSK
ncbi:helix-turn-helix domain-containing protein [Priestia koreensis]|uniref:helix-turn-helix domain-containing protein n=1 Tax=Priestia koreensis TaxID=284581 RepID=UPI003D01E496